MPTSILSTEIETSLGEHGIATTTHVVILDCESAIPVVRGIVGDDGMSVHSAVEDATKALRSNRLGVGLVGPDKVDDFIQVLDSERVTAGVVVYQPNGDRSTSRATGVMDVASELTEEELLPLLRRGVDFRALLSMELAHRCESRRLLNRELELLGQPPENMSDDLSTFQPPPLPVGPMSVYNLEEASEAFERAYIDRVQQLCASAREAAVYLGVSSATLSRRLRRETMPDGT